jgi:murein L,D-transpeptidase YcbB/YkuD
MPYRISISVRLALVLLAVLPASNRRDIWFQNGQPTRGARSLIEAFATAADAGLDPEDYHASNWRAPKMAARGQNDDVVNEAFTADAQRYIGDLRFGRIPARTSEMCAEIEKIVSALAISADPRSLLNSLDPPFPAFRRSLKVLEQYRRLAQADDGQKIPAPSRPVREGDEWSAFEAVRRRLRLLGDLADGGQLTDAIRCFQARHGLAITGAVDRATVLALNVPIAHRIRQIELTLERWRWAHRSFPHPPIVVNIPEFELRALDEHNRPALQMKVVVGRALGDRTPVFEAEMRYVIFNP